MHELILRGGLLVDGTGAPARVGDLAIDGDSPIPGSARPSKEGGGDPKNPLTPDFELWTFTLAPTRPELSGRGLAEAARQDAVHPVDRSPADRTGRSGLSRGYGSGVETIDRDHPTGERPGRILAAESS